MLSLTGILGLVLVLSSTRTQVCPHCEPVAGFSFLGHIVSLTTPVLSHMREQNASHEMSRLSQEHLDEDRDQSDERDPDEHQPEYE